MMIKGKFLSLAFIMVSFLGVTIWSLFNYDRTFNDMVKYNQLSAWSLAQLELELHGFDEQLSLYRSGQTDAGQLNKAYDIAWNRLDIFLTGQETALIRSRYQASERVGAFFEVLKEYEQDVVNPTPDSARLAEMEGRMNKLLPSIRDLMVMNFTGPSAIKQRQELQQSKEGHVLVLVALLAIGLLILFVVSREMKLQYFLAWNDPLTLLPNRAAFMTRLERLAKGKQPADCTLTICLVELNNFKEVNDSLGYAAGDELLTMVANQIREYAHDQAFIARMGGDEFALFIYGAMPIEHRVPYLVRLLDELRPTVFQADPAHRVRVSMGISQHPITAHKIEELILFADIALANAKKLKENHLQVFNHRMFEHYSRNRKLAAELREHLNIISNSTLYLHYQPVIKPGNAYNMGAEVLIRWNHPRQGLVMPDIFIPIAERTGMIVPMTQWLIERLAEEMGEWLKANPECYLSINISASHFESPFFLKRAYQTLHRHGIAPSQLTLEITERELIDNSCNTTRKVLQLANQYGFKLAIDDFGTGYNNLARLYEFGFELIKIDRSLVRMAVDKEGGDRIFDAILTVANGYGAPVLVEGVESPADVAFVSHRHIHSLQGWLFSKPITSAEFKQYHWHHAVKQTQTQSEPSTLRAVSLATNAG